MDKDTFKFSGIHSIILTLLILISSHNSEADIIILKNGRKIEVQNSYIEERQVTGVKGEETLSFSPADVKEIYKEKNSGSVITNSDEMSKHKIMLKDGRTIIVRNFWEENGNIVYEKYGATVKLPGSKIKKITKIALDPNIETVEYEGNKKKYKENMTNWERWNEYMKLRGHASREDLGPPGTTFYNPARE